jgi:serine/threonine protein kinase
MTDTSQEFSKLPSGLMLEIDRLCSRLESSWQNGIGTGTGTGLKSEDLLKELQNLTAPQQQAALEELLPLELEYRRRRGQPADIPELAARFPESDPAWLQQVLGWAEPDTILGRSDSDSGGFALATGGAASGAANSVGPTAIPEQLGDYRLLGILGQGGMGTVYRAVHERMGRAVAVKVLRADIRSNAALLQRFEREVRTAARLIHPNIVTALDARIHEGLPFLVTELVDGEDLETHVRRNGPLTVTEALDAIAQAAAGLAYAHEQGVVHRDIKPANLLRDRRGLVRILDMGLARLDDVQARSNTETEQPEFGGLTDSGLIMGTAAYMAPEQARDTRKADARSDLYSLGCTLHFLLTGRPPYSASSAIDMIVAHLQSPVPRLQDGSAKTVIPASVQELFERLAAKKPEDRIPTAAAVAAQTSRVREAMTHGRESALPKATENSLPPQTSQQTMPVVSQPPTVHSQRRQLFTAVGMVLLMIVFVVSFLALYSSRRGAGAGLPAGSAKVAAPAPPSETAMQSADNNLSGSDLPVIAFDGVAGYLRLPTVIPEAGTTYTLEAIIQPRQLQTSNVISWLGPDWMALFISDSGLPGTARLVNGQSVVLTAPVAVQLNRWTHLAAVFDSQTNRLFVDGREELQSAITFSLSNTEGGLFVGGVDPARLPEGENRRFFNGSLRGFKISRGVRYSGPFSPPNVLTRDRETIAVMQQNAAGDGVIIVDGDGRELDVVLSETGILRTP